MSKKSNFVLKVFSGLLAMLGFSSCRSFFHPNEYGTPAVMYGPPVDIEQRIAPMYGVPPQPYKEIKVEKKEDAKEEAIEK